MLRWVDEVPLDAEASQPDGHAGMRLKFWSADWTPWRALAAIRDRWPALTIHVVVLPVAE